MKLLKIFLSLVIIVVCVIVVEWAGLQVVSWIKLPYDPPVRLPDPPAKAEALLGISIDCGFFCSSPIIRAADGQSYRYGTRLNAAAWEISQDSELDSVSDCGKKEIRKLEAAGGKIHECLLTGESGELCPGPIVSYAITSNGEIWKLSQPRNCMLETMANLGLIFGVLGLVLGIVIVVLINEKEPVKPAVEP